MVLKLSLKLLILLNIRLYSGEVLGIFPSAKINPRKKVQD